MHMFESPKLFCTLIILSVRILRQLQPYSLGANVIPWEFRAESKPPVLKCLFGSSKHEKFWWQLCNLLGRVLRGG